MKDQAQHTAGTAKEEGRHVAGVATGEAQQVASEAAQKARDLMGEARAQVEEQSQSQLDRLVITLRQFGDDLEQMARGDGSQGGTAQELVSQVGTRARELSSQLQDRPPSELLDQVRGFARRRPGTFLLGALAAGVVAGRVTRGAKDSHADGGSTGTGPTGMTEPATTGTTVTTPGSFAAGTATDDPLAGTASPHGDPAYPDGAGTSGTTWGTPPPPPAPGSDPFRGTP